MTNQTFPDEPVEAVWSAMARFQDALADYYDSGMIGDPPKREGQP